MRKESLLTDLRAPAVGRVMQPERPALALKVLSSVHSYTCAAHSIQLGASQGGGMCDSLRPSFNCCGLRRLGGAKINSEAENINEDGTASCAFSFPLSLLIKYTTLSSAALLFLP
jgi:hypothetical protein